MKINKEKTMINIDNEAKLHLINTLLKDDEFIKIFEEYFPQYAIPFFETPSMNYDMPEN